MINRLGRANINFNGIFQFTDSQTISLISMDQQSGREWAYFFNKVVRVMSQAIKLLSAELVVQ